MLQVLVRIVSVGSARSQICEIYLKCRANAIAGARRCLLSYHESGFDAHLQASLWRYTFCSPTVCLCTIRASSRQPTDLHDDLAAQDYNHMCTRCTESQSDQSRSIAARDSGMRSCRAFNSAAYGLHSSSRCV
jgi:hypothetical protein